MESTAGTSQSARGTSGLAVRQIVKQYGAVRALGGVDLDIKAGEVHGLLGANGAGKSTLVKILAGVTTADSGTITWNGRPLQARSIREANANGVRIAHQEMTVFPNLTVAENIAIGQSHLGRPTAETLRRYRELFGEWGVNISMRTTLRELSPPIQATVALSKSLLGDAELIILDEPTAALSSREVDGLFRTVRRRVADGAAVIFVSHRLGEIAELCNTVTVMRNGVRVHQGAIENVTQEDLAELISAGQSSAVPPVDDRLRAGARVGLSKITTNNNAGPVLRVRSLALSHKVADVSFTVRAGEILGLAGLVGAGRTEVLEALVGLQTITSGDITLNGESYSPRKPFDAIQKGVVLVPEERAAQALFAAQDIGFNFSSGRWRTEGRGWGGWLARPLAYDRTSRTLADSLSLKYAGLRAPIMSLSGGNQQKVVLGRVMLPGLTVLLLDEPTRGVDVGARREVERIVRGLADDGVAVLYVASELRELQQCDRIVVMVEGRTTVEGPSGDDFDEDELTRLTFIPAQSAPHSRDQVSDHELAGKRERT